LDSGVYIAFFRLRRPQRILVGKLGAFFFASGLYLYVGSAQRNLSARIDRHARKSKPRRWHIDYLSAKADMLGVITIDGPRETECAVAKKLAEMFELAVPGFGASDCRCGGHLFYTPELP
jgi:sugar fermentation stimulation protein A